MQLTDDQLHKLLDKIVDHVMNEYPQKHINENLLRTMIKDAAFLGFDTCTQLLSRSFNEIQ